MPTFFESDIASGTVGVQAGDFLFMAASALDPHTSQLSASIESIADEVAECFARLDDVLAQAQMTRADLVKSACWISDESHRFPFIYAYKDQCVEGVYPQRVTMVARLPGQSRVLIEAIAHKRS